MTEKEREQLITLCDEIARMVPSHTLRDSSTEQFKEFIELLKKKVNPQEINAIIKAYHYFNTLMGDIKPYSSADTSTKTNEETKDSKETKALVVPVPVAPVASLPVTPEPNDTRESEEIVELLLHLSELNPNTVV